MGIYVFWESWLLELFVDEIYDFFVGKVEYIEDLKIYYWDIVLDSYILFDSVLSIEKDLSFNFLLDK